MLNIPWQLRLTMMIGVVLFFIIIFVLLKKKKLNVQYSIIWLAAAVVLAVFAFVPTLVAVISDIINVEMPVNVVFLIVLAFILLLLLSLSVIATGFSAKIKALIQNQAFLEERIRKLEEKTKKETDEK